MLKIFCWAFILARILQLVNTDYNKIHFISLLIITEKSIDVSTSRFEHSFYVVFFNDLLLLFSSFLPTSYTFMNHASSFSPQEECQPCLPGYYCDAEGLAVPSGKCWEGFFCLEGTDRPDPPLRDSRGGPCPEGDAVADDCV